MANIPQYISQFTGEEIDAGILAAQNAVSQNNVVQSTGSSTTNVMSQNAVTIILNENATNIATNTQNIANLQVSTGASISLSIDPNTYILSISLLNSQQTILSTATVDLPLESMVIGASYDDTTQSITLTLQNQQTVTFSVAALVSGLIGNNEVISHQTLPTPTADTPDFVQDGTTLKYKQLNNGNYNYVSISGDGNYAKLDTQNTFTQTQTFTAKMGNSADGTTGIIVNLDGETGTYPNLITLQENDSTIASIYYNGSRTIFRGDFEFYNLSGTPIIAMYYSNISPLIDNVVSLGTNSKKYSDLYLSGNLSDGTNSISIAEMVNKGTINTQTFNIDSTAWTALSDNTPYTYSTTVTLTQTVGDTNVVELINNQPTIFATYGFAIASISGQVATIYSIGQPTTTINLTVGVS